jgi:leucyl aminopeptidase (aminopeptidase T)
MVQAAWTRFAHKAVIDQAHVRPGEVFTVLTDDRIAPEIAKAVFEVGLTRTRECQLLVIRAAHYSEEPVHLNQAVATALKESDVVLVVSETRTGQIPEVHAAQKAGTRLLLTEPEDHTSFLIDGLVNLDYDKMLDNVRLFCDLWREGQSCKITSGVGTNLEFEVGNRPVYVSPGAVSKPGELDWFPGAMANVAPIETSINGTIAVDGSLFPYGLVEENVLIELEKGVITDISGGSLAMRFRAWLASLDDDVVYHLCHVSVGFNPRAKMTGAIMEDERYLGAITIGFGRQPASLGGAIKGGEHHVDVILKPPTIVAGNKTLLKDNEFNAELGFIAL